MDAADLCAGAAETCSPAICNLKPHTTVHLEARTYFLDRQVWLPPGARILGEGPGKTVIKACGKYLSPDVIRQDKAADVLGGCNSYTKAVGGKSSGRRGFLLGNDTYGTLQFIAEHFFTNHRIDTYSRRFYNSWA